MSRPIRHTLLATATLLAAAPLARTQSAPRPSGPLRVIARYRTGGNADAIGRKDPPDTAGARRP
jgi:tripartite-type tricarboxylate transporter receptor subunit TctC